MIDMPRIRCFLAAAKHLNFTEAAASVYLTQSSLSRHISLMEADLGFRLFDRSSRKVTLTAAGGFLYHEMRQAVDQLETSVLLARRISSGESGVLRLGVFETLAGHPVVLETIKTFGEENPGINFDYSFHNFRRLRDGLNSGDLDVVITKQFDAGTLINSCSMNLFFSVPVITMNMRHPLASGKSLDPEILKDQVFISISPQESLGAYRLLERFCQECSFVPDMRRYADNYRSLFMYLELEECLTVIDLCDIPSSPYPLKVFPVEGAASLSTVLVWKTDNSNPALNLFKRSIPANSEG